MQAFVQHNLLDRALEDDATIIVARSIRHWKLEEHKNVILYRGGEVRSAYLTPKSRDRILERLGL